jgi:predicted anti-sigma-YlaC factor YlaD
MSLEPDRYSRWSVPKCREAHRIVAEGMDRDLTWIERFRLRLHLTMCDACTRFSAQMGLLRSAMRKLGQEGD